MDYNKREEEIFTRASDLRDFYQVIDTVNPQDDSNIYITQEYYEVLFPDQVGKHGWIIAQVDIDKIDLVI